MKRLAITLAVLVGLFVGGQSAMAGPVRRVVGYGYGYGVRPAVRMAPRAVAPVARAVTPRVIAPVPRVYMGPRVYAGPGVYMGPRVYAGPGVYMGPAYVPAYPRYYSGYVIPRRRPVVLY